MAVTAAAKAWVAVSLGSAALQSQAEAFVAPANVRAAAVGAVNARAALSSSVGSGSGRRESALRMVEGAKKKVK